MISIKAITKIENGKSIATLFCDSSADVAALGGFASDHRLSIGSTCFCIDEGKTYALKSTGVWSEVPAGLLLL